ncbi:MAG: SelB C-terminal domain-containing protein, partial [Bacillota bacterium]|nr:SelB C-terminal domain-containing protein [Bacillota bacterium]
LSLYSKQIYSPPTVEEVTDSVRLSADDVRELLEALVEAQELVKVAEGMYFLRVAVCQAKDLVLAQFAQEPELTLATFRTLIDSSRKYALPLLEYFDQKKLTLRVGESRRPNSSFDSANLPC